MMNNEINRKNHKLCYFKYFMIVLKKLGHQSGSTFFEVLRNKDRLTTKFILFCPYIKNIYENLK